VAKKTRRTTAKKKPARSSGPEIPVGVRRALIVFTIVVLTAVLIGLGLERVRRYVNDRPGYRVDLNRVTVLEKPRWLSDADVRAMSAAAGLTGSRGFFEPDLEQEVRESWSRSPILSRTPDVARIHPNRVALTLRVRRPVAVVYDYANAAEPLILVDREGVRWPGRFGEVPVRFGKLPVITGVDPTLRTPRAGSNAWGDVRVRHGVAVAVDLLRGLPARLAAELEIGGISISNVGTTEPQKPEIVLEIRDGIAVEWGRSSASEHAGREIPVETKIAHLDEACRSPGLERVKILRVQYDKLGFVER